MDTFSRPNNISELEKIYDWHSRVYTRLTPEIKQWFKNIKNHIPTMIQLQSDLSLHIYDNWHKDFKTFAIKHIKWGSLPYHKPTNFLTIV